MPIPGRVNVLSLETRVEKFRELAYVLTDLPIMNTCYDEEKRDRARFDGKNNLAYFMDLDLDNPIGEGSYGKIYNACVVDKKHICAGEALIARIPKRYDDDITKCTADDYALHTSDYVLKNLIPNFPITVAAYLCGPRVWTIQEKFDMDLQDWMEQNVDNDKALNSILFQVYMTIFFLNENDLIHSDMKPANILIRKIPKTTLSYMINDNCYSVESEWLACVTDWDLARNFHEASANRKEILEIQQHYELYAARHQVISVDDMDIFDKATTKQTILSDYITFSIMVLTAMKFFNWKEYESMLKFFKDAFTDKFPMLRLIGRFYDSSLECSPNPYKMKSDDRNVACRFMKGERWTTGGEFHNDSGPAFVGKNGEQQWWIRGQLHREDGPAIIKPDGKRMWYKNGKLIKIERGPPPKVEDIWNVKEDEGDEGGSGAGGDGDSSDDERTLSYRSEGGDVSPDDGERSVRVRSNENDAESDYFDSFTSP
jgi:hypothetical protein